MDKWLYRVSLVLALVGVLVSIYMTIYKVTSNDALCLGSGDCSTVNASRYSEVEFQLPASESPATWQSCLYIGTNAGIASFSKTVPCLSSVCH